MTVKHEESQQSEATGRSDAGAGGNDSLLHAYGRDAAGRHWAANIVTLALTVCAAICLQYPGFSLVPATVRANMAPIELAGDCTAAFCKPLGVDCERQGGRLVFVDATGTSHQFVVPEAAWGLRSMPELLVMLVVGSLLAVRTWALGWVRKLILVLLAVFVPACLAAVFTGLFIAVLAALFLDRPEMFHKLLPLPSRLALFATAVSVGFIWCAVKAIIAAKPSDDEPATRRLPFFYRPALLCAVAAPLGVYLVAFFCKPDASLSEVLPEIGATTCAALSCLMLSVLVLLAGIVGQNRAVRWLWAPVLLTGVCAGGGMVMALAFMLAILARNDSLLEYRRGSAPTEAAQPIGDGRALRPLIAVAWVLILTTLFSTLMAAVGYFRLVAFWNWALIGMRWWGPALSITGILLARWDFLALPKAQRLRFRGVTGMAVTVGLICTALNVATASLFMFDPFSTMARKVPVPWPEGVEVDRQTYRNTSFPLTFGPYRRLEDDELGALAGRPGDEDNDPDGEITIVPEGLEALKIGTALDESRIDNRRSNWYVCRMYVDADKKRGGPFKLWRTNMFYYTGVRDQVPHVPEICLVATSATIVDSSEIAFTAGHCRPPWNGPLTFKRTHWRVQRYGRSFNYVQYYVFSVNDEPVSDRNEVRLKLISPWVEHSYWAKIEFSPAGSISTGTDDDPAAHASADKAAAEFVKQFLPQAIKALPTLETVEELDAAK